MGEEFKTVKKNLSEKDIPLKITPKIITIYTYFNKAKEYLDPLIAKLPVNYQEVLQKVFGKNYDNYEKYKFKKEADKIAYVEALAMLKILIIEKDNFIVSLADYLEIPEKELLNKISALPLNEQFSLRFVGGEEYNNREEILSWPSAILKKL